MSKICDAIRQITQEVREKGIRLGGTLESQNLIGTIPMELGEWEQEREGVAKLYSDHNLDLNAKYLQEEYHYKFLEYGLKQKIRATEYFFNQSVESRKNVLFSEDCISLLQWFSRPSIGKNFLNVYIRSSDVLGLLPCDLLYVWKIGDSIMSEYESLKDTKTILTFNIASAHIYISSNGTLRTREGTPIRV